MILKRFWNDFLICNLVSNEARDDFKEALNSITNKQKQIDKAVKDISEIEER